MQLFITFLLYIVKHLYLCTRMKNENINIRVEKKLKDKLQAMADKDNRTLSNFIEMQLIKLTETKKQ